MCQATFTMKFAKKYGIMVIVNKKALLCLLKLSQLDNMHKNDLRFLCKPKKRKENDYHV